MANSLHDKWLAYLNRPQKDDYPIAGGTGRSALGDNLLAASGSAAIDTLYLGNGLGSVHSFYVQVNASAGISAGAIQMQGSNDNVNFTPMAYVDGAAASAAAFTGAASTVAASTSRFYQGPLTYRYFKVVITTAFVGGTVSATARLSTTPYPNAAVTVLQNTPTSLLTQATLAPKTTGGNSMYTAAATNTAAQVKSGAGQVYSYDIHNPNAAISYVSFYDVAVGSVTVGTTTQKRVVGIPANSRASGTFEVGLAFGTAIVVAATTTRGGSTAPGTALDVNIDYT